MSLFNKGDIVWGYSGQYIYEVFDEYKAYPVLEEGVDEANPVYIPKDGIEHDSEVINYFVNFPIEDEKLHKFLQDYIFNIDIELWGLIHIDEDYSNQLVKEMYYDLKNYNDKPKYLFKLVCQFFKLNEEMKMSPHPQSHPILIDVS
jgi:hypothetical protein